jgi:enterochelin esterase-like enzyme
MYVYLPPGYDRDPRERFPVLEAAHGYPGSPRTWFRRLDAQSYLDREIAAGRMAPTVVLFPYQTPKQLLDTECTNLANGPQAETFLTEDVPAYARAYLRVRTDRAGWGLIGYSAGGYCATNLLLRHPGQYAAAASLSGFDQPGIKVGDGTENTANNDSWRLTHLPQPAVALYLAWAADDTPTRRASLRLARLARAPLAVTTAVLAHGGHSDAAWQEMEAPAFDWLSDNLARPAG